MAQPQLGNPGAVFGQTGSTNSQTVETYINAHSAALTPGDVVILDLTSASSTVVGQAGLGCKATTSAADRLVLGVVWGGSQNPITATPTYAVGAPTPICTKGVARINIGSNTVATTDVLGTSGTALIAAAPTAATAATNGSIGQYIGVPLQAQTAKDANNCILAYIGKM